jgi:hypothetical protein
LELADGYSAAGIRAGAGGGRVVVWRRTAAGVTQCPGRSAVSSKHDRDDADTHSDTDPGHNTNSDTDSDAGNDTHSDSDADADPHTDADADPNADTNPDPDTRSAGLHAWLLEAGSALRFVSRGLRAESAVRCVFRQRIPG